MFYVDSHYKILDKIGQGAYGIVVAAVDYGKSVKDEKCNIAVKKNEKTFE